MANEYTNVIFDGDLPGPTGNIAITLSNTTVADQKQEALEFFNYLRTPAKELLHLNLDNKPRVFIFGIRGSSKVRMCHAVGMGASAIGITSPIDGKLLALAGDGGQDIGAPTPIVLPTSMVEMQNIIAMSHDYFVTRLDEKGENYTWPLASRAKAVEGNEDYTVQVLKLAPIPPFLIYDGIDQDLDAATVYERVLSVDDHNTPMFSHLKDFLLAILTGHNAGDEWPTIPSLELFAPAPAAARTWARTKFETVYPTLAPAAQPLVQAAQAPQIENNVNIAQLLAQFIQMQNQNNNNNNNNGAGEEKKDDTDEAANITGFSQQEFDALCQMCGKQAGANILTLPNWIQETAVKNTSDSYKMTLIRKHIMNHHFYEEAEVPLTAALLKMVAKRSWAGKDGNIKRPSILHAAEGLSPFLVYDFTEDEVAALNDLDENIGQASYVTPDDIKALKTKFKPIVPDTAEKFMLMLKTFANLLFALFSRESPMFMYMETIIRALREYSPRAKEAMSVATKGSILWVILKQSRLFSIGEMTVLAEFQEVQRVLTSKSAAYNHAETPQELLQGGESDDAQAKKRKRGDSDRSKNDAGGDAKKKGTQDKPYRNPNCWHAHLKKALESALQASNHPSFTAIFKYCGTSADSICPKWDHRCAPNLFFGKCPYGDKCRKAHVMAQTQDIPRMLQLVDKFIKDPGGINQGQ
jgi:hypothetical protein